MTTQQQSQPVQSQKHVPSNAALDLNSFSSPLLARLAEEVRNDECAVYGAYDRTYNKHNR